MVGGYIKGASCFFPDGPAAVFTTGIQDARIPCFSGGAVDAGDAKSVLGSVLARNNLWGIRIYFFSLRQAAVWRENSTNRTAVSAFGAGWPGDTKDDSFGNIISPFIVRGSVGNWLLSTQFELAIYGFGRGIDGAGCVHSAGCFIFSLRGCLNLVDL